MKLKPFCHGQTKELLGYHYWCQGCNDLHSFWVPKWAFDGNVEAPTVTPSLLMTRAPSNYRCHLFLTAGKIVYCDDCNHALKGQTVDLLDLPSPWDT